VALELVIVTPRGEAYRGPVESVVLPGAEGEFGVLESHERFLSPLSAGAIEIRSGSDTLFAAVGSGFAEVRADAVAVLVDSCELGHEIDAALARQAEERARQELAQVVGESEAERVIEFEAALSHARARVAVAEKSAPRG